jgi:hypothetical protein
MRSLGLSAAAFLLAGVVASGCALLRDRTTFVTPAARPLPIAELMLAEPAITVTVAGGLAPWRVTERELLRVTSIWQRMHLADWNGVPELLRDAALNDMLDRYAAVLHAPRTWDRMDAHDWDRVPQPVRTVAYRQMIAYWSGFYGVGRLYDLPPRLVSDTLSAIVMSESWFNHRAVRVNAGGDRDLGLAQASDFARERLRTLARLGLADVHLEDEDYFNPWMATRFVAFWMRLMLAEAEGDLDRAVRMYNRGKSRAGDAAGDRYWATIQSRLDTFIRNRSAPDSWAYIWAHPLAGV